MCEMLKDSNNAVEAGHMYLNNYPDGRQTSTKMFGWLAISYMVPLWTVLSRNMPCKEENENNVLQAVTKNPEISGKWMDCTIGLAKYSAYIILRKHGCDHYKFRTTQTWSWGKAKNILWMVHWKMFKTFSIRLSGWMRLW